MVYKPKRLKFSWHDLSPEERERYISQDDVGQRELTYESHENMPNISSEKSVWGQKKKSEQRLIYEMWMAGKEVNEICYHVSLSRSQVHRIIKRLKEEIGKWAKTKLQRDIPAKIV